MFGLFGATTPVSPPSPHSHNVPWLFCKTLLESCSSLRNVSLSLAAVHTMSNQVSYKRMNMWALFGPKRFHFWVCGVVGSDEAISSFAYLDLPFTDSAPSTRRKKWFCTSAAFRVKFMFPPVFARVMLHVTSKFPIGFPMTEVEVCSGEGNLSRAMWSCGFKGKAFDVTGLHARTLVGDFTKCIIQFIQELWMMYMWYDLCSR